LLYADGTSAAGLPYEVEVDGVSRVGATDAKGAFTATAILPAGSTAVELRLLDGFGVGLAADVNGVGTTKVSVPTAGAGQLEDAYVLGVPKAMVLVTVAADPSSAVSSAVGKLDIISTHRDREILTMLSPARIVELRALGIEVLVLDVDANAYAGKTGSMSDDERIAHIDARMKAARAELAKLTASGAAPR
jgi:hypothetical protein